jgi:hypothetical protein
MNRVIVRSVLSSAAVGGLEEPIANSGTCNVNAMSCLRLSRRTMLDANRLRWGWWRVMTGICLTIPWPGMLGALQRTDSFGRPTCEAERLDSRVSLRIHCKFCWSRATTAMGRKGCGSFFLDCMSRTASISLSAMAETYKGEPALQKPTW